MTDDSTPLKSNETEKQEEVRLSLVKEVSEIPIKVIIYKGRDFDVKELIKTVSKLFYENEGIPTSTQKIVKSFGLEKAEKFANKVIIPHLVKEKGLIKDFFIKYENKHFFYPSAIILKPKKGEALDLAILPFFYENLQKISKKVEVNICKPLISLSEFLEVFENKNRAEVTRILIDIAKIHCQGAYSQEVLMNIISNRLLEMKVGEKTRDAFYKIGNLKLPFILWYGTGNKREEFKHTDIICEYIDEPLQLSGEIQAILEKIIENKKKNAKENGRAFDNHTGFRLVKITPKRELLPEKKDRRLQLYLTFAPTDFYTSVATNQSVDELILVDNQHNIISIRERYVKNQNLGDSTYLSNSRLSNMFGVALAVITEDNKILLQKRSQQVFMGPSKITLSTAEHMIRGMDEDKSGNPNPFITAQRCLKEEIGIGVELEEIIFLGFGIRIDNLLPQALGMVKLRIKSSELPFMKARDRWEGSNFAEDFSFEVLEKYFKEPYLISATAKLTILLALINQYGFEEIEARAKMMPDQMIFGF
jgi:hypothetical protein